MMKGEAMNRILLSYRRADSLDATGRIYDWLKQHFCRQDLFFRDIDDIPYAADFPEVLEKAIGESSLILVLIGPRWLEELEARQKLPQPDHVLMEIEAAGRSGKIVLPVLLNGTRMPDAAKLPESIRWLARANSLDVHGDRNFPDHVRRLADTLATRTGELRSDFDALMRSCRDAGLTWYQTKFDNYPLSQLIEKARELTIVLNDGRGWIDSRRQAIEHRLSSADKTTRVVLLHPESPFLETLVKKNKKPLDTQRYEIFRSLSALNDIVGGDSDKLQMRGHFTFNPITAFVSEDVAVISHYLYTEQGELPCFEYTRANSPTYYQHIKKDVDALFAGAKPIVSQDVKRYIDAIAKA
jgi:hypothetical protein